MLCVLCEGRSKRERVCVWRGEGREGGRDEYISKRVRVCVRVEQRRERVTDGEKEEEEEEVVRKMAGDGQNEGNGSKKANAEMTRAGSVGKMNGGGKGKVRVRSSEQREGGGGVLTEERRGKEYQECVCMCASL